MCLFCALLCDWTMTSCWEPPWSALHETEVSLTHTKECYKRWFSVEFYEDFNLNFHSNFWDLHFDVIICLSMFRLQWLIWCLFMIITYFDFCNFQAKRAVRKLFVNITRVRPQESLQLITAACSSLPQPLSLGTEFYFFPSTFNYICTVFCIPPSLARYGVM